MAAPHPLLVFILIATSIFTAAVAEFPMPSFKPFFEGATGNAPYDYQARLAGRDDGVRCVSQLISFPTGLGKPLPATSYLPGFHNPKINQLNP